MTAPAWIGPPSKVSSKSSPCAAVPLTKAAPAESSARVADRGAAAARFPPVERGAHVVGVARGDAQARHVDQQFLDDVARRFTRVSDRIRELFGD
jgi:hypothetical protein